MINYILRFLYRNFPEKYSESLCEEFFRDIPKEVRDPAIDLLKEEKHILEKWINYQAYILNRKASNDTKRAHFFQGNLTALKALLVVIMANSKEKKTERHKDYGEVSKPENHQKKLEDSLEGVNRFLKNKKSK